MPVLGIHNQRSWSQAAFGDRCGYVQYSSRNPVSCAWSTAACPRLTPLNRLPPQKLWTGSKHPILYVPLPSLVHNYFLMDVSKKLNKFFLVYSPLAWHRLPLPSLQDCSIFAKGMSTFLSAQELWVSSYKSESSRSLSSCSWIPSSDDLSKTIFLGLQPLCYPLSIPVCIWSLLRIMHCDSDSWFQWSLLLSWPWDCW